MPGKPAWLRRQSPRTRNVVIATGILTIGMTPFGIAATGDSLREGVRNGTATQETQIISQVDATNSPTGGYSTRQSNLSNSGGGAVYGCRSTAGSSASNPPKNPCIRANNLSTGQAFEFNASGGVQAGTINVGSGGDSKRPFSTNATGVATGLNADRLDSLNATDIVAAARLRPNLDADTVDGKDSAALTTRWLLVNEKGEIEEQSGGFKIIDAYSTNNNVYIDAGSSLEGKGFSATIAAQNKINVDTTDADADAVFDGELSVARCQTVAVECAPAGAKNANSFVVAPRNSDGSATAGTDANPRKRFYVTITE